MSDEMLDTPDTTAAKLHAGFAKLKTLPAVHGVLLALFALVTALILALMNEITTGPIAERATEDLYASLAQVIPGDIHDNDVTAGPVILEDPAEGPVKVYRATLDGAVSGAAFEMTSFGYGGRIQVLLGVAPDGTLLGSRVLSHAETPGLGDKIEVSKDDWILGFTGLSLKNPLPARWRVHKDGGQFDQFSGATITPRAVVDGIRRGLEFYDRNRATILGVN